MPLAVTLPPPFALPRRGGLWSTSPPFGEARLAGALRLLIAAPGTYLWAAPQSGKKRTGKTHENQTWMAFLSSETQVIAELGKVVSSGPAELEISLAYPNCTPKVACA